jgi:hypothetical protein
VVQDLQLFVAWALKSYVEGFLDSVTFLSGPDVTLLCGRAGGDLPAEDLPNYLTAVHRRLAEVGVQVMSGARHETAFALLTTAHVPERVPQLHDVLHAAHLDVSTPGATAMPLDELLEVWFDGCLEDPLELPPEDE